MKLYVIGGDPIALARPRFAYNRVFDCQKMEKTVAMLSLDRQHGKDPMFDGPVHLEITFYMNIPTSVPKKKKSAINGTPHVSNKDLDNLIKFVGDICNGICWADDRIVASINAKKIYDNKPRTEFTIRNI
jgi:Holliday junction resolvase RusA-like endonuclease